jgi:3-dehydroquinate synthase
MNYGHSFGHAIEAASQFSIPHGIAVTLGMDLANYVAHHRQRLSKQDYLKMSTVFRANAAEHRYTKIDKELFFSALAKDKKNIDGALGVILLNKDLQAEKVFIDNDVAFQNLCSTYLQVEMAS